jgi:hypothetical protein
MKQKDLVYLVVAVAILLGAGYLGFTALAPKKSGPKTVQVEVIGEIKDHMDEDALTALSESENFSLPVDLSGLNNPEPFGK